MLSSVSRAVEHGNSNFGIFLEQSHKLGASPQLECWHIPFPGQIQKPQKTPILSVGCRNFETLIRREPWTSEPLNLWTSEHGTLERLGFIRPETQFIERTGGAFRFSSHACFSAEIDKMQTEVMPGSCGYNLHQIELDFNRIFVCR